MLCVRKFWLSLQLFYLLSDSIKHYLILQLRIPKEGKETSENWKIKHKNLRLDDFFNGS